MTVGIPPRKLLLIDDDPDELSILSDAVEKIDARIEVRLLSKHDKLSEVCEEFSPDLILLDLNMPVFSGLDWLALLKKKSIDVPVIMYSTSSNKERVTQAYQQGAALYLTKPVEFKLLVQSMTEILELDWTSPTTIKNKFCTDGNYHPFKLST
jgi:DNA-binding NtrC family response regulator